ncbi:MAG: hypothetical protein ACXU82_14665 [Caulobacteraceae bacterium]
MADSADELLSGIAMVYQRWLAGALADEDALFEIGDLLARPSSPPEPPAPPYNSE